ncbi:hypothetical protein H0H87_006556 [Tephrocybe sp. NHM501043]|nr:hypothetical protein H0H87_006556 [Tephrocybe sp. NHM501043]
MAPAGPLEIRTLLGLYAVTVPLTAITTGAFLQGGNALVVLTVLHAGFLASFFWALLANALDVTQMVDDGTWSSLVSARMVLVRPGSMHACTSRLQITGSTATVLETAATGVLCLT